MKNHGRPGLVWARLLPILQWSRSYTRADLGHDLFAGVITAILLVPQGIAYALLAGLPPQVGLYAAILPPAIYAIFGTSRTLAVGPVSVVAILVASALGASGHVPGSAGYLHDAIVLAGLCGVILVTMALLRLGTLATLLSHPVLSGFTSAAAIIIIVSQLKHLTGVDLPRGESIFVALVGAWEQRHSLHMATALIGIGSIIVLAVLRRPLATGLSALGADRRTADALSRGLPLLLVLLTTALVAAFNLHDGGVYIVGAIPSGLPALAIDFFPSDSWRALLPSAFLISIISYVESVSVAKVLANRRRQRVSPNQEMFALGLANLGGAVAGSMPVAGGFSRSMVNYAAGARTQLATLVAVGLVAATALWLTHLFYFMPHAVLAAIIIVAVAPLIDLNEVRATWRYDRADFAALAATFIGVLVINMETGLVAGVLLSLTQFLWRAGRPHVAIVGRVSNTEHYRNIERHRVRTWPSLLLIRVDESLYFANSSYLEDVIAAAIADKPKLEHVVLICSAVNRIDHSALAALEQLANGLREAGITLHLSEIKGPVMDRLGCTDFLDHLKPGQVFLSTDIAVRTLTNED